MKEIPVIDGSGLRSASLADRRAVAARLHDACRNTGFFYATGHGVDPALIDGAIAGARRFFAQPMAEKQALSLKRSPSNHGYGELGSEQLDPDTPPDLNESFNIGLELPEDHPQMISALACQGQNVWPEGLPGWRELILDY